MTTLARKLYIAPVVHYWRDLEAQLPGRTIPLRIEGQGDAFLAVYEDLDLYQLDQPTLAPWVMTVEEQPSTG